MKEEYVTKYADVYKDLNDWDSQREAVKEAFMRGYETTMQIREGVKEERIEKLYKVIDILEEDFDWGGGENTDGILSNGTPDFEEAKEKIKKIMEE